jgi:hypothetical protein
MIGRLMVNAEIVIEWSFSKVWIDAAGDAVGEAVIKGPDEMEDTELEGLCPKREANGFASRDPADAIPGRAFGRGGRGGLLGTGGLGGRGKEAVYEGTVNDGPSARARGSGGRLLRAAERREGTRKS